MKSMFPSSFLKYSISFSKRCFSLQTWTCSKWKTINPVSGEWTTQYHTSRAQFKSFKITIRKKIWFSLYPCDLIYETLTIWENRFKSIVSVKMNSAPNVFRRCSWEHFKSRWKLERKTKTQQQLSWVSLWEAFTIVLLIGRFRIAEWNP